MIVSTVSCQALPSFIASSVKETHCSTFDTIPSAVTAKCKNSFLISILLFDNYRSCGHKSHFLKELKHKTAIKLAGIFLNVVHVCTRPAHRPSGPFRPGGVCRGAHCVEWRYALIIFRTSAGNFRAGKLSFS